LPSDFGLRTLPSRTYPFETERVPRPLAAPGGARGAVGYPGGIAADKPAPPDARSPRGASGWTTRDIRFGAYPRWFNEGDNPPTWVKPSFWNAVRWARGWFLNDWATKHYTPPVDQPSWAANAPAFVSRATSPLRVWRHWLGTWSIKRDYHQDAQRFPHSVGAGGAPMPEIRSATMRRMRSPETPRIRGGRPQQLSRWGRAPAWGAMTPTLRTAPKGDNSSDYGGSY
jgi:hypothetical protein